MALSLAIQSTTGEGTASIRKMSRWNDIKMMMTQGMDPNLKTDEERQYAEQVAQQMQQAQQQPQEDPLMVAAQAEMGKAQAAIKNEENDAIQMQLDHQYKMAQLQLDQQKLQLQAQELGIKLQDSNANVELKTAQATNQRVDSISKIQTTAQI